MITPISHIWNWPLTFVEPSTANVNSTNRRKQSRPRMVHNGPVADIREKPFKCRECDYQCRTKGNLVVHMRVHTGERPYRCTVCNKTFTQSSSCRTHMVIHYPNKPFKCDYPDCRFECNYKGNLVAHKRKHTGEKPYKCEECGKCFSQYAGLYSHKKLHKAHIQDLKDTLHWINYLETISNAAGNPPPTANNENQIPRPPPLVQQAPLIPAPQPVQPWHSIMYRESKWISNRTQTIFYSRVLITSIYVCI